MIPDRRSAQQKVADFSGKIMRQNKKLERMKMLFRFILL
jgi:hypothetical protein